MKKLTLLAFVVVAACVTEAEDGIDDSFTTADGKADTGGIADGSPEALGVLRVANEATLHELESDAGVSERAAKNIVGYRDGDDGSAGTSDDDTFDTLAELDHVPYVGAIAFRHLLDYARARGYVDAHDVYTLPACAPATFADLASHFQLASALPDGNFWKMYPVGGFTLTSRSRAACDVALGCTPWNDPSSVQMTQVLARGGYPSGSLRALPRSGEAWLEYSGLNSSFQLKFDAPEPSTPANTIRIRCGEIAQGQVADEVGCVLDALFPAPAGVTEGSILDFFELYDGHTTNGNTTMVLWNGRICADGHYQFVTKLGPEISASIRVDGANNANQIAISGTL